MTSQHTIEELVYSGKVMDDRGNWIPIAQQLRKEKKFLGHLERGEVYIDGRWVTMPGLLRRTSPAIQTSPEATVEEETTIAPLMSPEETVSFSTETIFDIPADHLHISPKSISDITIRTPEETVSFSTETLRDFTVEPLPAEADPPFPPETESLYIEQENLAGRVEPSGHPQDPSSPENNATVFEETVLYNIKVLKTGNSAPKGADTKSTPYDGNLSCSSPFYSEGSHLYPERSKDGFPPGLVLVFAAIVIIIAAVLIRVLL